MQQRCILEMEKTCKTFLCVLFCWWRTSLEIPSYQGRGRNLTSGSISPGKVSQERVLLKTNTICVEWSRGTVQSTFTTFYNLCSGETQRKNGGTCRQVGEVRCEKDVLLCRQGRWNFTVLATTIYPIWQKLHLNNLSYMAPDVASPRSKHNL